MRRRGRPKKNGLQPSWMFARMCNVVLAFTKARGSGSKHSCAVAETIETIQKQTPGVPISDGAVRQILAVCQPRGSLICFTVKEMTQDMVYLSLEERRNLGLGRVFCDPQATVLSIGFAPHPNYPRINAVGRPPLKALR